MNKERAVEIIKDLKQEAKVDEPELKYTDEEYSQALDIAIKSLETRYQMNDKGEITPIDNEWVDVRDRLPEQPYDKVMCRPALRTKPMLVSVNGDDWMKDKLYGTKNATYNQVILAYYSFRDNCWKDDDNNKEIKRDGGIHSYEVIAWKPLPKPYERKE